VESLRERRLLPRAERELFHYEVVRFHLEDLNAIAERRLSRRGRTRTAAPDLARVGAIVQAARWDRPNFASAIRRFVDEGRAEEHDGFGPALLLMAIEADDPALLATVKPPVRALARAVLDELGGRKAKPARARSGSRGSR
jgi:hypothetical protein